MTKTNTQTGAKGALSNTAKRAGASNASGASKTGTAKRTTAAARRTAKRTSPGTPAGRSGSRSTQSSKQGRQEPDPARLRPITERQSPKQILATVARDSSVEAGVVERVARSLSQTLQRHLIRRGSGRVEIPFLGAALWRGQEGARKARTMMSPMLGREVNIPAKRAHAVTRLRVHRALREIVARV